MKNSMKNPTSDLEEYELLLKQRIEEINNNIYICHDWRKIHLYYKGRTVIIEECKKPNARMPIIIYFLYEENPHDPIDDADTGSGYYPASNEDTKLAIEIENWYKNKYLKDNTKFKQQVDLPDTIWFKKEDGTITNHPNL